MCDKQPRRHAKANIQTINMKTQLTFCVFAVLLLSPRFSVVLRAVCLIPAPATFPGKKLRRNFTAETIAKRSRAFEQYLCHLCSLSVLQKALCVRHFFYLADLQAGQLLIRYFVLTDACVQQHGSFQCYIVPYAVFFCHKLQLPPSYQSSMSRNHIKT